MIESPASLCGSFNETLDACRLAARHGSLCHAVILGRHVYAAPGDNPHRLYKQYFPEMHGREFMDAWYARSLPSMNICNLSTTADA